MGICPKKFGPYFWGTLHLACLYSDDTGAVKALVDSYLGTLPCPACRVHFAEVLRQLPFPTDGTRADIFKWSVQAHNIVSMHLDKPQMTLGMDRRNHCNPYPQGSRTTEISTQ